MALATHNRPTYTERNRAWGVGMADPADLEPSHLTWRLRQKRRQPSAVSDVSATLALRYMDGRRWDRRAAWRLSIGSGVAKCKSAALFLAHAHRPSRPGPRARRASGRRPGAPHPHRLGDSQFAAFEAAGARALAVPPAERAGGRARPRSGAVPAGEHIRGYGGGAGARDAGPGTVHRGRRGARAVRADDARCVAQPSVDRSRLEFRREDAGRPVLPQPARPADGGGGFDPLRRGERGSDVAADRVLVAAGAGGGEPPREVPAALPPAVDGTAVVRESHGSDNAAGSRTLRAPSPFPGLSRLVRSYCTAFTMSKIGRYIATTMPPTMTPSTTIMIGSMRESSVLTAASTSSS